MHALSVNVRFSRFLLDDEMGIFLQKRDLATTRRQLCRLTPGQLDKERKSDRARKRLQRRSLKCSPFKTPPLRSFVLNSVNIHRQLRKIVVLKSQKRYRQASTVMDDVLREHKNINQIAKITGETAKVMYRIFGRVSSEPKNVRNFSWKLTDADKNTVHSFYTRDDITYQLPEARYKDVYFMRFTIAEAHEIYVEESDRKMGLSTFADLRPKIVKTIDETPFRGCLCEPCENASMIGRTLKGLKLKGINPNPRHQMRDTWCPETELPFEDSVKHMFSQAEVTSQQPGSLPINPRFAPAECVKRNCPACGVKLFIQRVIQDNLDLVTENPRVNWYNWGAEHTVTKKGKPSNKYVVHGNKSTLLQLLEIYALQLHKLSFHLFTYYWEQQQFRLCKSNLMAGQLLSVHDFGQNFLCIIQDEPKSSHWDHMQLTIHPSILYYKCECGAMIKEDMVHISTDKVHDKHAVHVFQQKNIAHVSAKFDISAMFEFTDNAARQYKSCFAFNLLSQLSVPTTRYYFGEGHGKSCADRCTGNAKQLLDRLTRSRQVTSVDQLVEQFQQQYELQPAEGVVCCHSRRKVAFTAEISRDVPVLAQTQPGTLKYHGVRNTLRPNEVEVVNTPCCCWNCMNRLPGCTCVYSDEWKLRDTSVKGPSVPPAIAPFAPGFVRRYVIDCENRVIKCQSEDEEEDITEIPGTKEIEPRRVKEIKPRRVKEIEPSRVKEIEPRRVKNITETATQIMPRKGRESIDIAEDEIQVLSVTDMQPGSPIVLDWSPLLTCHGPVYSPPDATPFNWAGVKRIIYKCDDFSQLAKFISGLVLPPFTRQPVKTVINTADVIDTVALHFMPTDIPQSLVPLKNKGCGDCLLHAVSQLVFGDQHHELEMRVRIIKEAIVNEKKYLNHAALTTGAVEDASEKSRAWTYAFYSGHYSAVDFRSMTDSVAQRIYQKEIFGVRKCGVDLSMWGVHHCASVIERPIFVCYPGPEGVNCRLRKHLHRVVLPMNTSYETRRPVAIMWSPLARENAKDQVKHFAALVKNNVRLCQI